jgi:hypothetical protein
MEPVPFTGEPEGHEGQQVMAQFDAPAFIRRARGVREALDHLLARCRAQRDEWLGMTRVHLGRLHALAGEWSVLRPLLADNEQLAVLEALRTSLAPKLRAPPSPTDSTSVLRGTLCELVHSLERFNARWQPYLAKVDRRVIDELRERYNKYYVLEKACALRSDVLARRGFEPMSPLTVAELADHLPLLPVPKLAE